METIPLELYETAYRLHYTENRISDAIAYYQKLIKEFPDSNECGYAVIQLQKIKAQNVAESIQSPVSESRPSSFVIWGLIAAIIIIIGLTGFLYIRYTTLLTIEKNRVSTALNALGKHFRGEDTEALKLCDELKKFREDDIFPYELSADIYRKQKKWNKSRNEYTIYFQNNPERKPTESEAKYMFFDEKSVVKRYANTIKVVPEKSSSKPSIPLKKNNIPTTTRKKIRRQNTPPPPQKSKGLFIVDPDSISYF